MLVKGGAIGEEVRALAEARWEKQKDGERAVLSQLLASAHEIIFRLEEGEPILNLVGWSFDPETFELVLASSWEISGFEDDLEELKWYIALALIHHAPVIPNSSDDEVALAALYRSLIQEGVVHEDHSSGSVRIALTRYGGRLSPASEVLERLSENEVLTAGEEKLLRDALGERVREHAEAAKVLAGLRAGIEELRALLDQDEVAESELQRCLTRNPLLFGSQYREVKPKHQLGNQYEMDYALVRLTGLVDLVEIERSTDPVYNKKGDPSGRLVHAEQQVLDWLSWIEEHSSYARKYLPGLERPLGYVVIGRDRDLDEKAKQRLARRNATLSGSLEVFTFDQLAQRAEALLLALTSTGG